MRSVRYKGITYKIADIPPEMEPTSPSDPKALVPQEKDVNDREITEPEKPKKVKPHDPLKELAQRKMEKKLERLKSMSLPIKILEKLIPKYNLPSAQILISDWKASKERLIRKVEEVLQELGKDET